MTRQLLDAAPTFLKSSAGPCLSPRYSCGAEADHRAGHCWISWLTALGPKLSTVVYHLGYSGRDAGGTGFLSVTIKALGISLHEETQRAACPFNLGVPLLALPGTS